MSERALKRILIGVVVLAAVYGVAVLLRSDLGSGGDTETGALAEVFADLGPDRVSEVLLIDGADTIRLARDGDRWSVDGFRADSGRVARFWDALAAEDAGRVVARNPGNHARLGVTDEEARRVVFRGGSGDEHELLLGSSGPTYPSVYVRLAGSDEVHLVESNLGVSAGQSLTTWRDHTIARVDTSRVRAVEITTPDDRFVLGRDDDGWSVDGDPADPAQARNLVGGLRRVVASDFLDDDASTATGAEAEPSDTGGEAPSGGGSELRRLVVTGPEGDTLADITIRGSQESGYEARAAGDATVYDIASFDVGRLFPSRESLLADDEASGADAASSEAEEAEEAPNG